MLKVYEIWPEVSKSGIDAAIVNLLSDENTLVSINVLKNIDEIFGVFMNEDEGESDEEEKKETE